VYRNDTLEFISHPEGRLRPVRIDTTIAISMANLKYLYDYYLKDHLGSVRAVLSTEQQTDQYAATMESAAATKENQLFNNISSTTVAKPGGFDTDNTNLQVSQLHGNVNIPANRRVGPSIVLKVMAGDTISISTYAWYSGSTQAPATGVPGIVNDILPLLTNGVVADGGTHSGSISSTSVNGLMTTILNNFLSGTQTTQYDNTKPKAFLNWMVVDEEFNAVSSPNHVGAVQVPLITGAMQKQTLTGLANMVVRRNGYLYVYVSNEANQTVYFDNLQIQHRRGPMVEQKDYYGFGAEIPGLATQAFKAHYDQNRTKYIGKELQSKEFMDGTGLGDYDYGARMYDPQIGRFNSIDPLTDYMRRWSPYSYSFDNPIRYADASGMAPSDTVTLPEVVVTSRKKSNDGWFSSVGSFLNHAVDYIPFAGSIKQIGMGIYHGDLEEAALGVVFLAVDAVTAGEGGEALRISEAVVEDVLKVGAEDEVKEVAEKKLAETVGEDAVHGNSAKSTKPTEKYTIADQNGKEYHGVGKPGSRAEQSIKRLTKENPGKSFTVKDRQVFPNRSEALKAEAKGMQGKTLRQDVYNKINSPGAKL
jgi:RHS repeat-associated protein